MLRKVLIGMKHTRYRYIIIANSDLAYYTLEERTLYHSKEDVKEGLKLIIEKDKQLREELASIDIDIKPSQYTAYRLVRVK